MTSSSLTRLLDILQYLRTDPNGCAWSKAQTHLSLIPSLIEESYETAETVDQGKTDQDLCEELGDVLLQIVFHAQIAKERGAFTFEDVAAAIVNKLTRRYPTILGDEPNTLKTAEEIDRRWEEVKAQERKHKQKNGDEDSVLAGISTALPALMRAQKIKSRLSKAGWEWPDQPALFAKIQEEIKEIEAEITASLPSPQRVSDEIGDLLFLIVDFARWQGIDAEDALRQANGRIEQRARFMERRLSAAGKSLKTASTDEKHEAWNAAKSREKSLS